MDDLEFTGSNYIHIEQALEAIALGTFSEAYYRCSPSPILADVLLRVVRIIKEQQPTGGEET